MPPASDLPNRILAEIDRIECVAQAATRGPWDTDEDGWVVAPSFDREVRYIRDLGFIDRRFVAAPTDNNEGGNAEDGRHIALNDPTTVLRHCEIDRRTIERHQFATTARWDDDHQALRDIEHCSTCTLGNGCDHCISEQDGDYELWPCATLRDLAYAYGITTLEGGDAS